MEEGSYEVCVYYDSMLYACVGGGVVFMSILGALRMYVEFALGWRANGYKSVRAILVIGGIFMVCVFHCVVLVLRIFVVVGCLCEV